ncbi:MAG: hypothetical protein M3220_21815, partial [Chloroflexota bacterium]|nr:hypothetical protein [Chloroflexota bacterium]
MAILQTLLTLLTRAAGRILNTVVGWATEMVFGKIPEDRQIYLSLIAIGSVAWMVAVLGVIFPGVATFLLTFIPLTEWINEQVVRLAMIVAVALLPLLIGFISLYLQEPEERPPSITAKAKSALTGYPYTLGLALAFVMMLFFAPVLKIRTMLRGWSTQHVPMLVDSEDYMAMIGEIQDALRAGGWETSNDEPSWMIRVPTQVLAHLTGGAIENLVASELTTLKSDTLEVVLHPSALLIRGEENDVMRARTILVKQLAFSDAHMTWSKEGNDLEERMEA